MKIEVIDEELPPEVEQYLALVKRAYDRMVETDAWPWPDDPNKPEIDEEGTKQPQTVSNHEKPSK